MTDHDPKGDGCYVAALAWALSIVVAFVAGYAARGWTP